MRTITTDHVDARSRIDFWESWNQDSLVGLHCSSPLPDRFTATSSQFETPDATITRIQASPHAIDRSHKSISALPKHSVFVTTLLKGTAFIFHAGGMQTFEPGDVLTYSTMQPYLLGFDHDMDLLIVDLGLDTVCDDWGIDPGATAPSIATAKSATARLADTALELFRTDGGPGAQGARLTDLCRELLLGPNRADELYERARALIRANLADADYSAAALAEDLHVSERHLRRIFADRDESPGASILRHRLEAARARLLADGRTTVSEVAGASGFRSPSTFTRAFRTKFDISPSELRGAGQRPAPRDPIV
ncbi:AraC family transcriptional regulator [Gulosibacter sp. 10]|uniref:AraC family transcriptional regulator n=1 Tax=Gulosibacter sp. 10 TaxID=1255570 RepID=UPI00097F2FA6|nr:AraC family transcriptional regulator [Gulosibacter sp. 10]SJM71335.1 Transcriptional regulator, AraC family [Gulosibacter sp. 10]